MTTLFAKVLGRGVVDGQNLHPLQISAGRFVFAWLVLLPIFLWQRPGLKSIPWGTHVGRAICGWAGVTCMFAAAAAMALADATAISFLSPLVTMLAAIPLLGEKVGPWRWFAAVVALCGAWVLIRPGEDSFQAAALIALAAAFFMGFESIFVKKLTATDAPLRILFINNSIGATAALSAASFVWIPPTPAQWGLLAAIGVVMVTAQVFFIMAMRRADASFVVPFMYATLVFAAFYDFGVFGTIPDTVSALGAGLIVTGGVILAWRESRLRSAKS